MELGGVHLFAGARLAENQNGQRRRRDNIEHLVDALHRGVFDDDELLFGGRCSLRRRRLDGGECRGRALKEERDVANLDEHSHTQRRRGLFDTHTIEPRSVARPEILKCDLTRPNDTNQSVTSRHGIVFDPHRTRCVASDDNVAIPRQRHDARLSTKTQHERESGRR